MSETAIYLAIGLSLAPLAKYLLRRFVTIPINDWVIKRIKSERIRMFLGKPLDIYRED